MLPHDLKNESRCQPASTLYRLKKNSEILFLDFGNNSLESLGIVHGEFGKHLTVDLYSGSVDKTHKLGI